MRARNEARRDAIPQAMDMAEFPKQLRGAPPHLNEKGRELRGAVLEHLYRQGFVLGHDSITLAEHSKDVYRYTQETARNEKLKSQSKFLRKKMPLAKEYLRDGKEIDPEKIELEMRLVKAGTFEADLYRFWNLIWWSVPYERAYGRQLRFLLWDRYHDAPFGLIGLHSSPLRMQVRDDYLGITVADRDWWVNMSLSAQRVGALPPYNELLGGKMVALALGSQEIRRTYTEKYQDKVSWLRERELPADLLFVTTTGAFGRSSMYNRLRYRDEYIGEFIGYTRGSGTFHITDTIYCRILDFLEEEGYETERGWGNGPSRKRQLITRAFQLLGLPDYQYHGIKRSVYLFNHVSNIEGVIGGEEEPVYADYPFAELADFWLERWAVPRSKRRTEWLSFSKAEFLLEKKRLLEEI